MQVTMLLDKDPCDERRVAHGTAEKRWVATAVKLGPGYRTKRGAEMPDWVAVAHLPSCKVRRVLHRWSIEVPRAILPNRQRTMRSFYTAAGARVPTVPASLPAQAAAPVQPAPRPSSTEESSRTAPGNAAQSPAASDGSRRSEATAPLPKDRRHSIADVPAPWGVVPQQDALRGAITCYDADRRRSYAAPHKCHSTHDHWPRCIVVDHPDVAMQWEGTLKGSCPLVLWLVHFQSETDTEIPAPLAAKLKYSAFIHQGPGPASAACGTPPSVQV